MSKSKIEWTDRTWNPVTGCTKVSPGCANCYAERMAKRLRGRYGYWQDNPFKVTHHPERLDEPFTWRNPSKVFVCSMGDLFHKDVDGQWIYDIMEIIRTLPRHIFIILTKRPENMLKFFNRFDEFQNLPNVWLGVSAENQEQADERIPILLQIPAAVRIVSCEPLLGPVDLSSQFSVLREQTTGNREQLNWVICGGESGHGARPMHPDWARSLRDQCQAANVPFFFKQWGEYFPILKRDAKKYPLSKLFLDEVNLMGYAKIGKKAAGRLLDGREHNEFPSLTTKY